jgi:hypothetical protein
MLAIVLHSATLPHTSQGRAHLFIFTCLSSCAPNKRGDLVTVFELYDSQTDEVLGRAVLKTRYVACIPSRLGIASMAKITRRSILARTQGVQLPGPRHERAHQEERGNLYEQESEGPVCAS